VALNLSLSFRALGRRRPVRRCLTVPDDRSYFLLPSLPCARRAAERSGQVSQGGQGLQGFLDHPPLTHRWNPGGQNPVAHPAPWSKATRAAIADHLKRWLDAVRRSHPQADLARLSNTR